MAKSRTTKSRTKAGQGAKKPSFSSQEDLRISRVLKDIESEKINPADIKIPLKPSIRGQKVGQTNGFMQKSGYRTDFGVGGVTTIDDPSFELALHKQGTTIPLGSFLDASKTSTGIFSQKDVDAGLSMFKTKLQTAGGVTKQEDPSNKIFSVSKDYQKTEFKFNPNILGMTTKGWELDIPENFIKVNDTKYVAPTVQYKSGETWRDDRDTRYTYGSYTPTEIELYDNLKKIKQITERDTYSDYTYDRYSSRDGRGGTTSAIYTKEQKQFFDTGLPDLYKQYGLYSSDYLDRRRGDIFTTRSHTAPYLKREIDYAEEGKLLTDKEWKPYESYYYHDIGSSRSSTDWTYRTKDLPGLFREKYYDKEGDLERMKQYGAFTRRGERRVTISDNLISRDQRMRRGDIFLERDDLFAGGRKIAGFRYSPFERGSRAETKELYETTEEPTEIKFGTQYYRPSTSFRRDYSRSYDTSLKEVEFYNPLTGKKTEVIKLW